MNDLHMLDRGKKTPTPGIDSEEVITNYSNAKSHLPVSHEAYGAQGLTMLPKGVTMGVSRRPIGIPIDITARSFSVHGPPGLFSSKSDAILS